MCSIFGFVNYGNKVKGRHLKELVKALKYITKGVSAEIPIVIQILLFQSIDIMREKVSELDRSHVMKLEVITKDGISILHITHDQEVPEGHVEYFLPFKFDGKQTFYVIDDADHVTMLIKSEY